MPYQNQIFLPMPFHVKELNDRWHAFVDACRRPTGAYIKGKVHLCDIEGNILQRDYNLDGWYQILGCNGSLDYVELIKEGEEIKEEDRPGILAKLTSITGGWLKLVADPDVCLNTLPREDLQRERKRYE